MITVLHHHRKLKSYSLVTSNYDTQPLSEMGIHVHEFWFVATFELHILVVSNSVISRVRQCGTVMSDSVGQSYQTVWSVVSDSVGQSCQTVWDSRIKQCGQSCQTVWDSVWGSHVRQCEALDDTSG